MYHKGEGRAIIRVPSQGRSGDSWDSRRLQSALANNSVLTCQRIFKDLKNLNSYHGVDSLNTHFRGYFNQ